MGRKNENQIKNKTWIILLYYILSYYINYPIILFVFCFYTIYYMHIILYLLLLLLGYLPTHNYHLSTIILMIHFMLKKTIHHFLFMLMMKWNLEFVVLVGLVDFLVSSLKSVFSVEVAIIIIVIIIVIIIIIAD